MGDGGGGGGGARGGRGFQKLGHLGGLQNFLLEMGDKPEQVEWDWCKNGGVATFFITLQFNHIYCMWGGSKVPVITFQILSLLS